MKRKFALATAIATLTASLSVFSGVPVSAKPVVLDNVFNGHELIDPETPLEDITWEMDFVVISVDSSNTRAWLVNTSYLPAYHSYLIDDMKSDGFDYGSEEYARRLFMYDCWRLSVWTCGIFEPVIEQLKPGDIVHYHSENGSSLERSHFLYMDMNNYEENKTNDTLEITGSIFDTPLENFKPYTDGDLTAVQVTLEDGTELVVEDWCYLETREDQSPVRMLSNGNTDTGFSDGTAVSDPEEVFESNEMLVLNVTDDYALVAWGGVGVMPDQSDIHCRFYRLDMNSPELAPIAPGLKYGDVIYYTGTGEMTFAGKTGIDDMSFTSGEGKMVKSGSVLGGWFKSFAPVVTDERVVVRITDADEIEYVVENEIDYDTLADFIEWENTSGYTGSQPGKYTEETGQMIYIRKNEDGDVNSDDKVDSADAAVILEEIALYGVGGAGKMNTSESKAADVNGDGAINAKDAALILSYSAQVGSGMLEGVSLKAYAAQ
ncbi:MAG: dockerin type I repeat-containing protein [Oscillospiraceae bacterium]|nr:dockerin type I repeat-containing protein [Oscillospiraceae bacterium]